MGELNRTSAKDGTVTWGGTLVGDVVDINFSESVQIDEGATSDTGGVIDRTAGHKDLSGSFVMQEEPDFNVGDEATLLIKYRTGKNAFNGNAVIISIDPAIPVGGGGRINWTVNWGRKVSSSSTT